MFCTNEETHGKCVCVSNATAGAISAIDRHTKRKAPKLTPERLFQIEPHHRVGDPVQCPLPRIRRRHHRARGIHRNPRGGRRVVDRKPDQGGQLSRHVLADLRHKVPPGFVIRDHVLVEIRLAPVLPFPRGRSVDVGIQAAAHVGSGIELGPLVVRIHRIHDVRDAHLLVGCDEERHSFLEVSSGRVLFVFELKGPVRIGDLGECRPNPSLAATGARESQGIVDVRKTKARIVGLLGIQSVVHRDVHDILREHAIFFVVPGKRGDPGLIGV
mmetsp:Transcript_747/g.1669  ORF Transcript_747/g.1669 Transcript_747/m.1669 type:complete len:271 (+) Transcript_747:500-1312(+)